MSTHLDDNIEELLHQAKPDAEPRAAFQAELQTRLRERMASKESAPTSISFFSFLMDARFLFAGGGAVLGGFLVLLAMNTARFSPIHSNMPQQFSSAETVEIAPEGFGALSQNPGGFSRNQSGGGGGVAMGLGGGGGMPMAEGKIATDGMMMPPMDYYVSRYMYDGEIVLPSEDQLVYHRTKPSNAPSASNIPKGFADGLINWNSLNNLRVQSLTLSEPGNGGMTVTVDFNEGFLSLYKNFDPAAHPESQCADEDCYERYRLKEGDMPSDAEVTQIASAFVRSLGLDMSRYGEPQVMDDWRVYYASATMREGFVFPEQINVVFPLLIDGKIVYEEYGMPYGVNVSVDIRSKTATSLYNYTSQSYESSLYAPLTDQKVAANALERGSVYTWDDPNAKKAYATLGEPTEAYMHFYQWDQKTYMNKELMVPALVFPVTKHDEHSYDTRKNVLLPLVAEMYEQGDAAVPMPRPLIEPMMDGSEEADPATSGMVE